ncbi:unnamed protein product [Orchesella dallaii]|uniref:Uncharacterized protein n=1 Tax=Orchesella dallaii TaxID=48710 RepID=A0ABP1S8R3_9HEXA
MTAIPSAKRSGNPTCLFFLPSLPCPFFPTPPTPSFFSRPPLPLKTVIGISISGRRINKDSKNVVDNTLAKVWNCSEETYKTQLENPRRQHWDELIREIDEIHFKYFLYLSEDMEELRSRLDLDNQTDPEYNPFLLRSIRTISCCAGCDPPTGSMFDVVDEDYRALHALVSEYGKHVWSFNVHLLNAWKPQFLRQGIVKLFTQLMHLPNLKTLVISIRDVDPLGGTTLSDFVEGCTQLLVPKLEKLVHLNVVEIKADILATELIRHYKNQLTTFKCHGRWFETGDCMHELKSLLPNLTKLVVDNGDDGLCPCVLYKVAQVNWPLEVLKISSTGLLSLEGEAVEAVEVLRAVCNFRETLIELVLFLDMIDCERSDICDTNNCIFQVFPKLNKLTTWWENTDVDWFWNWVQSACKQLHEIEFWSYQFTNIEREAAKAMFGKMSKLQKVVFWYFPDPGNENDQRPAQKATVSRPSTTY